MSGLTEWRSPRLIVGWLIDWLICSFCFGGLILYIYLIIFSFFWVDFFLLTWFVPGLIERTSCRGGICFFLDGLFVWVSECVREWVSAWVSAWVSEWVSECVSEWVSEWVIEWLSECVRARVSECVSEWVSERVTEWVSERVSEWVSTWWSDCGCVDLMDFMLFACRSLMHDGSTACFSWREFRVLCFCCCCSFQADEGANGFTLIRAVRRGQRSVTSTRLSAFFVVILFILGPFTSGK